MISNFINTIPHPAGATSKPSIFSDNDFRQNHVDAITYFRAKIIFFYNYNSSLSKDTLRCLDHIVFIYP
jgi:accessory colonization factor AcfC